MNELYIKYCACDWKLDWLQLARRTIDLRQELVAYANASRPIAFDAGRAISDVFILSRLVAGLPASAAGPSCRSPDYPLECCGGLVSPISRVVHWLSYYPLIHLGTTMRGSVFFRAEADPKNSIMLQFHQSLERRWHLWVCQFH